jgi:Flp pilus assembly protein TadG
MKMTKNSFKGISRKYSHRRNEAGQSILFLVLILGIFLLGALCFAFDLSNMWFHRQAAQTAADAACTAGAMDLLVDAQGGATGNQGFTLGTAYSCSSSSTDSVCKYAALNGYSSANTAPGDTVNVSFPSSVNGVTAPGSTIAATPFIRVDIDDHVQTFFLGLLSGGTTKDVRAFATCGVELASAPIPILVLDPRTTAGEDTLAVNGTPTIAIYGGPQRSVQVNSGLADDVIFKGSKSLIDLSQGGPNLSGSDLGVYGGQAVPGTGNFKPGTTGTWISPAAPISDPFAQMCAPGASGCSQINGNSVPAVPTTVQVPTDLTAANSSGCTTAASIQGGNCTVAYNVHGCPNNVTGTKACVLYTRGAYPGDIAVKNGIAVFDEGLYYVTGGLALQSNSTVRPGTSTGGDGDGSGGTTFYFSGSGTVTVAANSGSATYDPFLTNTLPCPGTSTVPPNLPASLQGNVLIAPCSGYYGDPLGTADTIGEQRNLLFFQDRSATNVNPNWGGGGQFLLAGTMYFHSCNSSGTGTGCTTATPYYTDNLALSGNSASGTYLLGDIIVDQLTLGGTSGINMDLNPTSAFSILKASIFQ